MSVKKVKRPYVPRRKIWKLKEVATKKEFSANIKQNLETKKSGTKVEDKWTCLEECLLEASDRVCRWSKRRLWKQWKTGSCKERYLEAKRKTKSECMFQRNRPKKRFHNILRRDDENGEVFKTAKQMT